MAIMTRMLRLCKADVHGVMDQLEDKALMLKQYLREMEASLDLKTQQVRNLTQRLEGIEDRIGAYGQEAAGLEQDLSLALRKQKDDIARMLIRKRRALDAAAGRMNAQKETLTREKARLGEILAEQRLQYDTLKVKADAYCQRPVDGLWDECAGEGLDRWGPAASEDAEIEMELLQRKETMTKGGTP